MRVTYYRSPNGRQIEIDMANIYPEDEEWFQANQIDVSLEELSEGSIAVYGKVGETEQGEPIEAIVLDLGRTCEETMKQLRHQCTQLMAEQKGKVDG